MAIHAVSPPGGSRHQSLSGAINVARSYGAPASAGSLRPLASEWARFPAEGHESLQGVAERAQSETDELLDRAEWHAGERDDQVVDEFGEER